MFFLQSVADIALLSLLIFIGLFSCLLGGIGLELIGTVPLWNTITFLVFGATMAGGSGGQLERWTQIYISQKPSHPTIVTQIVLVLGVIIYAEIGMYCGRLALKRNLVPIQGQEPAT